MYDVCEFFLLCGAPSVLRPPPSSLAVMCCDLQVLPDWILAIMLIVLLAATANRTLRKGIKSYNKETVAKEVRSLYLELLS